MKKLNISPITDSASMPLKSGSLEFLQQAHQETTIAIANSLIGYTPDPTKGYIINGVNVTNTGSSYTVTNGYLYFNNEIFKVNGSAFILGGGQQIFATITNIPYPLADPVLFGDNVSRNVHLDRQITFGSGTSGDILYINCIRAGAWLTGDIKEVDCTNGYLAVNFDGTGLGINERLGWAICNGQNGTKNRNGLVSVAYGTDYTSMGVTGGSKNAVLIEHDHTIPLGILAGVSIGGSGSYDINANTPTNKAGVGETGVGKNMQPYIVTLFIQKL
jgi:hypothetical protein